MIKKTSLFFSTLLLIFLSFNIYTQEAASKQEIEQKTEETNEKNREEKRKETKENEKEEENPKKTK